MNTLSELRPNGRVLLRLDLDLPVQDEEIQDDRRLRASHQTIQHLLDSGATQLIITGHRGRPKGHDPKLSTQPIANHLSKTLQQHVTHVDEPLPSPQQIPDPDDTTIVILENVRYVNGETEDNDAVAERLARLADSYVFDAFATSHRKHSSTHAIQRHLPAHTGFNVESELRAYHELKENTEELGMVLGGAKVKTKLNVLQALQDDLTTVCVAGTMMHSFFDAKDWETGQTEVNPDTVKTASAIPDVILPETVKTAESPESESYDVVSPDNIPADAYALDVSDDTAKRFSQALAGADHVVWNGPLGYYENPVFASATEALIDELASHPGKVIIGGGDTGAIIEEHGRGDAFHHVSTGGGAFLTLLEHGSLPVVDKAPPL